MRRPTVRGRIASDATSSVSAISARATPGPAVETLVDALQAAPGGEPDQQRAARSGSTPWTRDAFFPLRGIEGNERDRAATAGRPAPASGSDHRQRMRRSGSRASACRRGAGRPSTARKASAARLMPCASCAANSASVARSCAASSERKIIAMISPMPMPNASERKKRANARSAPMIPPGVNQREDVRRRREEEERDRRTDAGALCGRCRRRSARSCTNRPRARSPRRRPPGRRRSVGVPAEKARDCLLGNQRGHGAGDEEGGQQAQAAHAPPDRRRELPKPPCTNRVTVAIQSIRPTCFQVSSRG